MELIDFNIQWTKEIENKNEYWFYRCRHKIDKQTLEMRMYQWDYNEDTIWFSIMLSVHNKRKHIAKHMDSKAITGNNPLKTISIGLQMFDAIEKKCVEEFDYFNNIIIFCTWLDKRRRDAYYRILSRRGYKFGTINGEKVIMKKWSKKK